MGRSAPAHLQRGLHPDREVPNPPARNPLSPGGSHNLQLRPRRSGRRRDREADEGQVQDVYLPAELVAKLVLGFVCSPHAQLERLSELCVSAGGERLVVSPADVALPLQRVCIAHRGEVGVGEGVERSTIVMGLVTVGILKVLSSLVKSFTSSASLVLTSILSSLLFDVKLKYPEAEGKENLTAALRSISQCSIWPSLCICIDLFLREARKSGKWCRCRSRR